MAPQIGHEALIPNPGLEGFSPFIGVWTTVGHHPMVPGVTFHGRVSFEWSEGGAFVIVRSETDEKEIPSGIAIFGSDDGTHSLTMLYFDERKVARLYGAKLEPQSLHWWRNTPEFSQRFTVTISPDGNTMKGVGAMSKDGGPWGEDLGLTYTRARTELAV